MNLRWENSRTLVLLHDRDWDSSEQKHGDWMPGDTCHAFGAAKSMGMIVSFMNDENVLVLWTHAPTYPSVNPCGEILLAKQGHA